MNKIKLSLVWCTLALLLSGFSLEGAQPQVTGVSPSFGSGTGQTFTLTVSDADGAADVGGMNLLFGGSTLNGTNACWIYFDHVHHAASLADDSGLQWTDIGSGSPARAQNTRCSVGFVSASDSGNTASVSLDVRFTEPDASILRTWARAGDLAGADSGYQQIGQYQFFQASAPDFTVTVSPASQAVAAGHAASYQFTVTSLNGLTGSVNSSFSYSGTSTLDAAANQTGGAVMLPAGGSVSGTFQVSTGTDTPSGTLNVMDAISVGNATHSVQFATVVNPASMPDISVSPSSGGGSDQTFTFTVTDPGGFAAIKGFHFLLSSSLDTRNSCWFYFERQPNWLDGRGTVYLASDDTRSWTAAPPNVIGPTMQNGQCMLFGGPVTTSAGGNTLTVALPLSFFDAFAGSKNIYLEVTDNGGTTTGYQQRGQWNVVGGTAGQPDFQLSLYPAGNDTIPASGQTGHSIVVTRVNGFSGTINFNVIGVPPSSTVRQPDPVTNPGDPTSFSITTSNSTPPGTYPLTITGTSGALTHSISLTLTVSDPGLPRLSMSPASGSGSPETFAFNATGSSSSPGNVTGLSILFGSSVDGRNACWIFEDGNQQMWLASDDTLVWSHTDSATDTLENSQCRVTQVRTPLPLYALSLIATITFKPGFTGTKNVYMDATTKLGRDTGYIQEGTWTLP